MITVFQVKMDLEGTGVTLSSENSPYTMVVYNETNKVNETSTAKYDVVTLNIVDEVSDQYAVKTNPYKTPFTSPNPGTTDKDEMADYPVVTNIYANADGTGFRITATAKNGLSRITDASGDVVLKGISGITSTANIISSSPLNAIRVYDVKDKYCTVDLTDATIITVDDVTASGKPTYTVTYNKGYCTITVNDTGSGIWKITDATGNEIVADYST